MTRRLVALAALLTLAGPAASAFAEPPTEHEPRGDRMVRPGHHEDAPVRVQAAPAPAAPEPRAAGAPNVNPTWSGGRGDRGGQPRTDLGGSGGWSRQTPATTGSAPPQPSGGWRERFGAGARDPARSQGFAGLATGRLEGAAQPSADQTASRRDQWRQREVQAGSGPRGDWNRNDGRWTRQADQAEARRDWRRNQPWAGAADGAGWSGARRSGEWAGARNRGGWGGDRNRTTWRRYGEGQRFSYRGRSFFRWRADPFLWPIGFGVRRWRVHEILPPVFLDESYFIEDWSDFGLPPAPYGFQWIRVGDDALLVDVYTGEVVDEVQGVFYW